MVSWWKLIWFPQMISRHAFICWLAMKHRLLTRDGLVKWGVHSDVLCLFLSSEGPPIVLMRTKKFAVNGDYLLPFSGIVGPLFRLLRR